jgi:hypothetical protein
MADSSADVVRVPLANVNLDDSGVKAQMERVKMVQALVYAGYDPSQVLAAFGIENIDHTGLASSQLQMVSQIDPENPASVYEDKVS